MRELTRKLVWFAVPLISGTADIVAEVCDPGVPKTPASERPATIAFRRFGSQKPGRWARPVYANSISSSCFDAVSLARGVVSIASLFEAV